MMHRLLPIYFLIFSTNLALAEQTPAEKQFERLTTRAPEWSASWENRNKVADLTKNKLSSETIKPQVTQTSRRPAEPLLTRSKGVQVFDARLEDYYLSGRLGEQAIFDGFIVFKRTNGMVRGEGSPGQSDLNGSPHPFALLSEISLVSPTGMATLTTTVTTPLSLNNCPPPQYDPVCAFAFHQYHLESPAIDASLPEGLWGYTLKLQIAKRIGDEFLPAIYEGTIEGEFLVDSTPPSIELLHPGPGVAFTFPVGVTNLTFQHWDPNANASGIAQGSGWGVVADRDIQIVSSDDSLTVAMGDFTDLRETVQVFFSIVDLAGNTGTGSWLIDILEPDPIAAGLRFIGENRELLGIEDPSMLQVETTFISRPEEELGDNSAILTVRLQQEGPGGLIVHGSGVVFIVSDRGEVLSINNAYSTSITSYREPVIRVTPEDLPPIVAAYYGRPVSSLVLRKVWFPDPPSEHEDFLRYRPVYEVLVSLPDLLQEILHVDIETGEVHRRLSLGNGETKSLSHHLISNSLPSSGFFHDRGTYLLRKGGSWQTNLYTYPCEHIAGESCYFSEYVAPRGNFELWNAYEPTSYEVPSAQVELQNVMYWSELLSKAVEVRAGLKLRNTMYTYLRGSRERACEGWYVDGNPAFDNTDPLACTIPFYSISGYERSTISFGPNVLVTSEEANDQLSLAIGDFPSSVMHETAHAFMQNINESLRSDGTYVDAFHEGFAFANECAYFECAHFDLPDESLNGTSLWADDEHDAGRPLSNALISLVRRFQLYPATSNIAFRGLDALWEIPKSINIAPEGHKHLGQAGNILRQAVNAGAGFISGSANRLQFHAEILDAFTEAGIPIGSQVKTGPAEAVMISFKPTLQRFAHVYRNWGGETWYNQFMEMHGSLFAGSNTTYRIRFYLNDPKTEPAAVQCHVFSATPTSNAGRTFLGKTNFRLDDAFDDCYGYIQVLTLFQNQNCEPFSIWMVGEIYKNGTLVGSTLNRTDVLGATPFIRAWGGAPKCKCSNSCPDGGCNISGGGSASIPISTLIALGLVVAYPLRRVVIGRKKK